MRDEFARDSLHRQLVCLFSRISPGRRTISPNPRGPRAFAQRRPAEGYRESGPSLRHCEIRVNFSVGHFGGTLHGTALTEWQAVVPRDT